MLRQDYRTNGRRARRNSDVRLQGQFLSQYQAENGVSRGNSGPESSRVKELERELKLARGRERQYERERQAKLHQPSRQSVEDHDLNKRLKEEAVKTRSRSRSRPRAPSRKNSDEEWRKDEREFLRQQWGTHQPNGDQDAPQLSTSPRPLPEPAQPVRVKTNTTGPSSRPLPDPANYAHLKSSPKSKPYRSIPGIEPCPSEDPT